MHRVLVLGAGFGGIATALGLRDRLAPEDEVVLVDRRDDVRDGPAQELGHRGHRAAPPR